MNNTICITDSAGNNPTCAAMCSNSTDCGSSAPCCTPLGLPDAGFSGRNACVPFASNKECRCSVQSDCSAFSPRITCGLIFEQKSGAFVVSDEATCQQNDGNDGDGCVLGGCNNGLVCAHDSRGNTYCSLSCSGDVNCGNPGVSCCNLTAGTGKACGICGAP